MLLLLPVVGCIMDAEIRVPSAENPDLSKVPSFVGSTHLQVPRVETLIEQLELFRSNYRGMRFVKYLPDRLAIYFFLACLETVCGLSQSEASWSFNSATLLVSEMKRNLPSLMPWSYVGSRIHNRFFHNRNRARVSCKSITHERGSDMRLGKLVFKLSIEHS